MTRTILLTNDDGYDAGGLQLLIESLAGLGDIFVSAPTSEQSATSHSLSLRKPIALTRVKDQHYRVGGTPTDSVLLGVSEVIGRKPDLIVSGINHGPNMGEDVTYSGTVAAAIEGTILGVPSVAISSLQRSIESREVIGHVARRVVEKALEIGIPVGSLLNVNIPDPEISPLKGVRITKLGSRHYENLLAKSQEGGQMFFTIGGDTAPVWREDDGSDIGAVRTGYVSVTPMHLDLTDYKSVVEMERWRFAL